MNASAARNGKPLLQIRNLSSGYGDVQVLWDVSLEIQQGEVVALIGANGAGKTTLLCTVSQLIRPWSGLVHFDGQDLTHARSDQVVAAGIVHVPQGRRLFAGLSVKDNLLQGAYLRRGRARIQSRLDWVVQTLPRLKERLNQAAGLLSGGEQQMCAIGRALMSDPKLLLLDEPSAGLAPVVVQQVFELVKRIRANGLTVLIVEQNVQQVLRVVDRAYLMEAGSIRASGKSSEMLANDTIRQAYLGV